MQLKSVSNTTFCAKIIPSKYFNKAIDLAKEDVACGSDEALRRAATFYNNLKTIELDNTRKELAIKAPYPYMPPILKLDNSCSFIEISSIHNDNTGLLVQEAINSLADSKYSCGEIKDYAKDVDLKYAFDVWKKRN